MTLYRAGHIAGGIFGARAMGGCMWRGGGLFAVGEGGRVAPDPLQSHSMDSPYRSPFANEVSLVLISRYFKRPT